MLVLSGVFMLLTFVVVVGYGLFAASVRRHVIARPRVLLWMRGAFAGVFVALGAKLALAARAMLEGDCFAALAMTARGIGVSKRNWESESTNSSALLISYVVLARTPTLCRIISLASAWPSIRMMRSEIFSTYSSAPLVKLDVVKKIPLVARTPSRLPAKA